jgi:hypothetical protein
MLDAKDVRSIVTTVHPDARETATHGASVLSFMVGMHSKETLCRINVYLETGTVGCVKVLNDQVRECFQQVSTPSREALTKVLHKPPKFAMLMEQVAEDGTYVNTTAVDARDVTAKIELAEVGVCILMGEREKLQTHLKAIQASSSSDDKDDDDTTVQSEAEVSEQTDDDDDDDDKVMAGLEFDYSLSEDVLLQTDQCLEDITAMDKQVSCVSTNGKGCVFLYGNGGVAYTPNIPKQLYHKLKALKSNPTRPSYVAIGTRERYYVSFHNGTFDWKGPKSLGNTLKKVSKPPRCIAFGPAQDAYFVVYHDGSWEYNGRSIPNELIEKLKERKERPDLVCVTLGPKGEWFLRTENGRLWWGGIGDELDELIQSLLESDRFLNFLDFGEDHSYFVSYD